MSGSLREIDITTPARWPSPPVRRDYFPSKRSADPEILDQTDKPVLRATEGLASGKGVVLPRFTHAIEVYQQNIDARRTLLRGPFFVDTYA